MERPQLDWLEALRQLFRLSYDGEAVHTETRERLMLLEPYFEDVEDLDLSGVYEHYKSTADDRKLYYVDSVKREVESGECLVVYTPLYEPDNLSAYARPLSIFAGSAELDGQEVMRFRPIYPVEY